MDSFARLSASGLAVVLWLGSSSLAQGPGLDIPEEARKSGLLPEQKKQIDRYVEFWVKMLQSATDAERVITARSGLVKGYAVYGSEASEYQYAYAETMAKYGKVLLATAPPANDALWLLKEVNFSIAVGRVSQTSILPLLDVMVSHRNPGVRYFGWYAYGQARAPVLGEGATATKAMYAALAKAGAEERDSYVISELMGMFRLPPEPPAGVLKELYGEAQGRLFEILRTYWTPRCLAVMTGDPAAAEAAYTGVMAANSLLEGLGAAGDTKAGIQMALNVAWSAGRAFDTAEQLARAAQAAVNAEAIAARAAGPEATPETRQAAARAAANAAELAKKVGKDPKTVASLLGQAEHAVSANTLLLKQGETVLNRLTNKGERFIEKPLFTPGAAGGRGAAVRLGVLKWEDVLVKEHGVKRPEKVLAAATTPATAPAPTTAPATAPKP